MRLVAPAKINLSLLVSSRDETGFHPLRSLVQTIDRCDTLDVEESEKDELGVVDDAAPVEDNLVWKAVSVVREQFEVAPIAMKLAKQIPMEAGLGGGSTDAAAALVAALALAGQPPSLAAGMAQKVGADVAFPLVGGTAEMTGYGEVVNRVSSLDGFALAVVVPDFGLSTPDVYRVWDELGEPVGFDVPDRFLPPQLRHGYPIRNDLFRAAVEIEPRLGDFVSDVAALWDSAVLMTGSGTACFGFFSSKEEAAAAAAGVSGTRAAFGASLRDRGVEAIDSISDS